jgi:hypothetical protein
VLFGRQVRKGDKRQLQVRQPDTCQAPAAPKGGQQTARCKFHQQIAVGACAIYWLAIR